MRRLAAILLILALPACARVVQRRYGTIDTRVDEQPNRGVDFGAMGNKPILAAAPGIVAGVVDRGRSHRFASVVIAHEEFGVWTWYQDLGDVTVERGQRVTRGEVIGHSGGMHRLHLELCTNPLCEGDGPLGGTRDPLEDTAGCFDPAKKYPTDRLALTYAVRC